MYDRYSNKIDESRDSDTSNFDLGSLGEVYAALSEYICSTTGWDLMPTADDDFFVLGMDSLHATRLARIVKSALVKQNVLGNFDAQVLYNNPNLKPLSVAVFRIVCAKTSIISPPTEEEETINVLIDEYSHPKICLNEKMRSLAIMQLADCTHSISLSQERPDLWEAICF